MNAMTEKVRSLADDFLKFEVKLDSLLEGYSNSITLVVSEKTMIVNTEKVISLGDDLL